MEHIRNAFNASAAEYDAQRKYVIPALEDFYGAAAWAADSDKVSPRILDIGAGTGLLCAYLLQKYPQASFTLMDIARNMLDIARERFRTRDNVRMIVADYRTADLGGPYDIVCSALSIHHLAPEEKCRLFERIHAALSFGGIFVNADQADGETPYFRQRFLEYWNEFLQNGPLNEAEHRDILRRRNSLDRNERLSVQLGWLQKAGFTDVDVVYRNRTFIVTAAKKGREA